MCVGVRESKRGRLAHHIDSPMLSIMDLVVADDGAAVGPDLDARQGIAVYIIAFNETPSITKYVYTALVAIEDGISSEFVKWMRDIEVHCTGGKKKHTRSLLCILKICEFLLTELHSTNKIQVI